MKIGKNRLIHLLDSLNEYSVREFSRFCAPDYRDLVDRSLRGGVDLGKSLEDDRNFVDAVRNITVSPPGREFIEKIDSKDTRPGRHRKDLTLWGDELTPGQIIAFFGAVDSTVSAVVLEGWGQGEIVNRVADTLAWPLGVLGLYAFMATISRHQR